MINKISIPFWQPCIGDKVFLVESYGLSYKFFITEIIYKGGSCNNMFNNFYDACCRRNKLNLMINK